jgi:hypothetical protein
MLNQTDTDQILRALDNHEYLKNSYFWSDNGNGAARSARERELNFVVEVEVDGHAYTYTSSVTISRQNFYYKGRFSKDGVKGDVRTFKKLLA